MGHKTTLGAESVRSYPLSIIIDYRLGQGGQRTRSMSFSFSRRLFCADSVILRVAARFLEKSEAKLPVQSSWL